MRKINKFPSTAWSKFTMTMINPQSVTISVTMTLTLKPRCELQLISTTELKEEQYKDKRLVVYDKDRHGGQLPFDTRLT